MIVFADGALFENLLLVAKYHSKWLHLKNGYIFPLMVPSHFEIPNRFGMDMREQAQIASKAHRELHRTRTETIPTYGIKQTKDLYDCTGPATMIYIRTVPVSLLPTTLLLFFFPTIPTY